MNRRKLLAGMIVGLVAAAVAAYALWPRNTLDEVTFVTLKGEQIKLHDLRGKAVLVNFWATSCPACIKEMPELVKSYERYRARGLEIVAVAMAYDPPTSVKEFAEKHALPFPVALDTQEAVAKAFDGVKVVPTTFVLDKNGQLVSRTLGMIAFDKLHTFLDQSLGR